MALSDPIRDSRCPGSIDRPRGNDEIRSAWIALRRTCGRNRAADHRGEGTRPARDASATTTTRGAALAVGRGDVGRTTTGQCAGVAAQPGTEVAPRLR